MFGRKKQKPTPAKPISPKLHGAIDYGFLGLNLAAPSLLGLKGPARMLPYLIGGVQGGLNAVTDQPYAARRAVPFPVHGAIEKWSAPAYVLLPVVTGALKQPRARAYFGGLLGVLATVWPLTDWNRSPRR
jgi:hypothetical protein